MATVTDFGQVASDIQRAATSFALLTSSATMFGRALSSFRMFERQLVMTNAIAQGTQAQFRQMSEASREFALATTTSAIEAGAALQNLAQAGFSAEESLAGMNGVLLLASATMSDVALSSDMLSSNIRAFGLDAGDTMRVANLFTSAMNNSLATMDKLTFALRQVGPVAEVANLGIEETTAFLGELFNIGLRGEQAGTALRNVIVRLVRPTGEAAKILQEFGIATIDATGNFRGLEAVLGDIARANLSTASLAMIFENEALAGALALMKAVTPEAENMSSSYRKLLASISGTDAALILTLKNLNTFDGAMKLLNNTVHDVMITIGEQMAPAILMIANTMRDALRAFNDLDEGTKQFIASMAGWGMAAIAAAAAFHGLLLILRLMGGKVILNLTKRMVMSQVATNAAAASFRGLGSAAGVAATGLAGVPTAMRGIPAAMRGIPAAIEALGQSILNVGPMLTNFARNAAGSIANTARSGANVAGPVVANVVAASGGLTAVLRQMAAQVRAGTITALAPLRDALRQLPTLFAAAGAGARTLPNALMSGLRAAENVIGNFLVKLDRLPDPITLAERGFRNMRASMVSLQSAVQSTASRAFTTLSTSLRNLPVLFTGAVEGAKNLPAVLSTITTRAANLRTALVALTIANVRAAFAGMATSTAALGTSMVTAARNGTILRTAMTALTGALVAARTAALGFVAAITLPMAVGIAAVTAAVGAAVYAFDRYYRSAERAAGASFDQGKYDAASASFARRLADSIGTDVQFAEVDEKLRIAQQLIDSDLVRLLVEGDLRQAISTAYTSQQFSLSAMEDLTNLRKQLGEEFVEYTDEAVELQRLLADRAAASEESRQAKGPIWGALSHADLLPNVGHFAEENRRLSEAQAAVKEFRAQFTEQQLAIIDGIMNTDQAVIDRVEAAKQSQQRGIEAETVAIRELIETMIDGQRVLAVEFEQFGSQLSHILQDEAVAERVVEALLNYEGQITDEVIASIIYAESGRSDIADRIADVATARQKDVVRKIFGSLAGPNAELFAEIEVARRDLAKTQADLAKTLADAIKFEYEAGIRTLEIELKRMGDDLSSSYEDVMSTVALDTREDIMRIVKNEWKKVAEEYDLEEVAPAFSDMLSGEWLIEQLRDKIDENTTPEQARAIAMRQGEIYREAINSMIETLINSIGEDKIDPDLIQQFRERVAGIDELISMIVESELANIERAVERRTKQFDKKDTGEKEAAKALRIAQKIRDAYMEAANASLDARRSFYEAISGLGIDERIAVSLGLDTEGIALEYESIIRGIQDKIADIELNFEGPADELNRLKQAYADLIPQVEAAARAEIEAADTFTKQMERRADALDLFVRDLTDAAMKAKNQWDQVGAGIAAAFAEYNKELVTVIDITKNATTDLLDTISTGIGDFIYDTENAWENFKKNMLNISRQVFEGFTKAFIQQSISSMTGGGGSIFGNAVAPGRNPMARNNEMPSVGTGGILERLFPGLMGTMRDQGDQSRQAAQIMQPLKGVLQSIAEQTRQGHTTALAQQRQVWTEFTGGLRGVLNTVLTDIRSMSPAGGTFGQAFPGAAAADAGAFGQNDATMVSAAISDAVRGEVQLGFNQAFGGVDTSIMQNFSTELLSMGQAARTSGNALQRGIAESADALGVSMMDLATVISYETAGTFDPRKMGPVTPKWGQHRGLIQFGVPQSQQFGVDFSSDLAAIESQLGPNGAIVQYMRQAGVTPGTSLLDMYSAVNAGYVGRYGASDAHVGGAPGTVADKVAGMGDHMERARQYMGEFANTHVPEFNDAFTQASSAFQQATGTGYRDPNVAGSGMGFTGAGFPAGGAIPGPVSVQPIATSTAVGEQANPLAGIMQVGAQMQGTTESFSAQFTQLLTAFNTKIQTTLTNFTTQFQTTLQQSIASLQRTATMASSGTASGFSSALAGTGGSTGFAPMPALYAMGGEVRGAGTGTSDSILSWLSNGEFVVNAKSTGEWLPILQAINDKKDPESIVNQMLKSAQAFAQGGVVTNNYTTPRMQGGGMFSQMGANWQKAGGWGAFGGAMASGLIGLLLSRLLGGGSKEEQEEKARLEEKERIMLEFRKNNPWKESQDVYRWYEEQPMKLYADGGLVKEEVEALKSLHRPMGEVSGRGSEKSDSIMAWLSNHEFVVNAAAAKEYLPLLETINAGGSPAELVQRIRDKMDNGPRLAGGGLVGDARLSQYEGFGFLDGLVGGSAQRGATTDATARSDKNITLNANYTINVNGGDANAPDKFRQSASQHAKELGRHIDRAKKNL